MNEQEQKIAAKLLTQIENAEPEKQSDEIMKYVNFMGAATCRLDAETRQAGGKK